MSTGEKYLAAAYLVLLAVLLLYVAIIAAKLARMERDVDELTELARKRADADADRAASREEARVG